MFPNELLDYLSTKMGASWNIKENLFVNSLPKNKSSYISLYEAPGGQANKIIAVYSYRFRLMSKSDDPETARINWQTAFDILNRLSTTTLPNYYIALITALDSNPYVIRDDPGDHLLESDFLAEYKNLV